MHFQHENDWKFDELVMKGKSLKWRSKKITFRLLSNFENWFAKAFYHFFVQQFKILDRLSFNPIRGDLVSLYLWFLHFHMNTFGIFPSISLYVMKNQRLHALITKDEVKAVRNERSLRH